jgi:hypothetical protein
MKKIIYTTMISLMTLQVQAQGVEFGIKAGINIANCNISTRYPTLNISDHIAAFHGGVYLKIDVTKKISIQPEMLYSIQGYDRDLGNTDLIAMSRGPVPLVFHERLTYLQFPVLFRYNIVPKFNLHVGPQFSYLVAANRVYDYTVGSSTSNTRDAYAAVLICHVDLMVESDMLQDYRI